MRSLLWLALGAFAVGTEGFMIAGLLPRIAADLGATVTQAGWLVTVFGVTYAVGSPVIAVLTSGIERKRLLIGALLAFGLANLFAAAAPGFLGLLTARALLALTAGAFMPTASAYAATTVAPDRRGRALSMVYTGFTLALAIGVPLGTAVGVALGWRATFMAVAGMAGLAALGVAIALKPLPGAAAIGLRARMDAARMPGVPSILVLTIITMIGAFATFTFFAPFIRTVTGVGEESVALFLLLFGVAAFFGNLAGGRVADRVPARRALRVISAVVALTSLAMTAAGHLPHAIALPMTAVAVGVWGLFGWSFLPLQQARLAMAAPALVSVVLSLNASAIYVGVALGSSLGGLVVAHASVRDITWVGVAAAVSSFLWVTWTTRRRSAAVESPPSGAIEYAAE